MIDRTLPFVSVIIPVLNGERTIRECLVSLLEMDYPPERREILAVDNNSRDRTAEIINRFPVRYVWEGQRGISHARNRGIEASEAGILAFTDADCVVTTRWLREMVQGFKNSSISAVEGQVIVYPPVTPAERFVAMTEGHSLDRRLKSPFYPFFLTGNIALHRNVFQRIGLFDPHFPAAEDVDFSWRFFKEGDLKHWYNPKAVVFHRERTTSWDFFLQQARNGRGLATLQAKYPSRLPWGWRQEVRAWCALASFAWIAARTVIRFELQGGKKMDVYYPYFTFLRKLAVRLGFLWETLAGGYR